MAKNTEKLLCSLQLTKKLIKAKIANFEKSSVLKGEIKRLRQYLKNVEKHIARILKEKNND